MLPPRALLLAAVTLAAPACATSDSETATGHVATYEPAGDGGDAALLEGVVEVADGCLLVRAADRTLHLPSFPDDEVGWSDGRLSYDDATYADGDPIALGGGTTGAHVGSLPDACRGIARASPWTVAAR